MSKLIRPTQKRENKAVLLQFRITLAEYAKIKLMAAAERRPINAMSRELVLRAIEHEEQTHLDNRRRHKAGKESPEHHAGE